MGVWLSSWKKKMNQFDMSSCDYKAQTQKLACTLTLYPHLPLLSFFSFCTISIFNHGFEFSATVNFFFLLWINIVSPTIKAHVDVPKKIRKRKRKIGEKVKLVTSWHNASISKVDEASQKSVYRSWSIFI